MSFKTFIDNIGFARYHVCFETKDPYQKKELTDKMDEFGIKYSSGYMEMDGIYSYAVISVKGGKEKLMEFVDWFKKEHEWGYHITMHRWFKNDITCLCWVK